MTILDIIGFLLTVKVNSFVNVGQSPLSILSPSYSTSVIMEKPSIVSRFLDKEWPEEWIEPTLFFKSEKNHFSVKYQDNSLFTLKLI